MPVRKLQVFLASRFDEFAELRRLLVQKVGRLKTLPAEAIDLNDNYPDTRPPLDRCCESIDGADLVLLLVGNTYGSDAQDGESFTHLEYQYARKCGKVILTFLIGEDYVKSAAYRPSDVRLHKWLEEILDSQCAGKLDPKAGWSALADEIYSVVLERLWEAAETADITPLADLFDSWEESPITLQAMTSALKNGGRGRALRSLAADHADEAVEAFELNLPQVALHHLRKVDELVRLDPLPGYWLSWLLLTSPRRIDWKEARRLALRCADIAMARNDGVPELLRMACWINAARASERLGELDPALQHAQAAHDDKPYHWLAKLELGRQLALAGKAPDALRCAREAFWLKPGVINRIHGDQAYLSLGENYHRFRRDLRSEVTHETFDVLQSESALTNLAHELGISDLDAAPPQTDDASLLAMINAGRASARRTLHVARRCAAKLAADARSFQSAHYTGLTDETLDRIGGSVRAERATLDAFGKDLVKERANRDMWRERTMTTAVVGVLLTIAIAVVARVALDNESIVAIAATVVLVLAAGGAITWHLCRSMWTNYVSSSAACSRLEGDIQSTRSRFDASVRASEDFHRQRPATKAVLERFIDLVDAFEKTAGKRLAYAPAVPRQRRNTTDLVRMDGTESEADVARLSVPDLLPEDLAAIVGHSSPPRHRHWFAQRVGSPGGQVLSRQAAYFN